jgi:hypothetical protein
MRYAGQRPEGHYTKSKNHGLSKHPEKSDIMSTPSIKDLTHEKCTDNTALNLEGFPQADFLQ